MCICGEWDLTGLPCKHVTCCIVNKRDNVEEDYMDDCYRKPTFMAAFRHSFGPVSRPNVWPRSHSDELPLGEPYNKRMPGRPKLLRVKGRDKPRHLNSSASSSADERPLRATFNLCGSCKKPGHNSKTCKNVFISYFLPYFPLIYPILS